MTVEPFDYGEARDDADELIEEFGQTISIRRLTNSGSAYAPTQTPTDYATKGARVDFTWRQMQRSDVLANDQRWLVAAGPLTAAGVTAILPGDLLVIAGSVVGEVVPSADAVAPGGVTVVYDLQVRV